MTLTKSAELLFESGESSLGVRHLRVREGFDELFRVEVLARSPDDSLDLGALVGRRASLTVASPLSAGRVRTWAGVCVSARQLRTEPNVGAGDKGLSTYEVVIAPRLWLLTQRRSHRQFQHVPLPDMVDALLADWGIVAEWRVARAAYPPLELRTQYDETDYAFLCRLLEEAGITLALDDGPDDARLVLLDDPAKSPLHAGGVLPYFDDPTAVKALDAPYATGLARTHEARPGTVILRDYDPRNPRFALYSEAHEGGELELACEQYRFAPGSFLREGLTGSGTPVADDRGTARFDPAFGEQRARVALEAARAGRRRVTFETNRIDASPGTALSIMGHPAAELAAPGLLVRAFGLEGAIEGEWRMWAEAVPVTEPIRPAQRTPKPRMDGLQLAVVVGPEPGSVGVTGQPLRARLPGAKDAPAVSESAPGDDVYCDEFGRVRVQFPWDREGTHSAGSSIWMRVGQSWAGPGHGLFSIPRIGTEVLVGYLGGDPDAPVVVGTLHNMVTPAPYKLPDNRSVTTWRSATSPGREGFNELRFDDTAGREHVYLQAQQDMDHLVRNDKQEAVGRDRAAYVQRDETRAVGHNLLDVVKTNAMGVVGSSRSDAVGLSRTTSVGVEDSTVVGSRWSVSVARGLSATLGPKLASLLDGPLGSVLAAAAPSVLGRIANAPLGGVEGGAGAALAAFRGQAQARLQRALGLGGGASQLEGPPPTTIEMVDRRIELTTGEASIILDGPNISFRATGNVVIDAMKSVSVVAEEELALAGREQVAVLSLTDDVVVQASKKVKLNPFGPSAAPPPRPRAEGSASPSLPTTKEDADVRR